MKTTTSKEKESIDTSKTGQSQSAEISAQQSQIQPAPPIESAVTQFQPQSGLGSVDLFSRPVNGGSPIKSVTFRRLLTPPLVAMAHRRELLFECKSEMYQRSLPGGGRTEKELPATLIDGIDLETGEVITLICNAMMKSAFERATPPLINRAFGLRSGDIKADKKYRIIDVIEIDVER